MRSRIVIAEVVACLVVLVMVVAWIVRGPNFEPFVAGVSALAAFVLELLRRRDSRREEKVREAARRARVEERERAARERPRKLTDEATLTMWLQMIAVITSDELSARADDCIRESVLMDRDAASAALAAAKTDAASAPNDLAAAVIIQQAISKSIPSKEVYLAGLRDLGAGVAVGQLRPGYHRAMQDEDSLMAWVHLLWLEELGESDALRPMLTELFLALARQRYRGDLSTVKLGDPVMKMAKRVQGINYPFWWNDEILPVLRREAPPGLAPRPM
jgi:hypothetical protein